MLTADHIFTCLLTHVLCVPLSTVFRLSIFEPTNAESARPWHSNTYTYFLDVDITAASPYVCMHDWNLAMVAAGPVGTPMVAHQPREWQRGVCTRENHLCFYPCTLHCPSLYGGTPVCQPTRRPADP